MLSARFAWPLALLAGAECVLLFAALCLSEVATGYLNGHPGDLAPHAAAFALVCVLVTGMMFSVGLYTWHAASSYADLAMRLLAAFITAYLVYAALVYAVDELAIAPGTLGAAIVVAAPTLFLVRVAFIRLSNQAHLKSRILVLGTGEQAKRIGELEQRGRAARFVTISFVDLNDSDAAVPAGRICRMPPDLLGFARSHGIDEIVIAMEDRRGRLPADALIKARLAGLRVTDYQRFREFAEGRVDLGALRPSWFLYSDGFRSGRIHRFLKRAFDIAVSLGLLAVTLPLIVLTAIAIRLESTGPVFYRQERVGFGGRPFTLLKFRSMAVDAEASGQAQWAAAKDPRVTRVGAIIRKTRIDEIPQAINVLRGDMSFVGPRPERPQFVEMLTHEIPYYTERHCVKPGITGWAQLNYPYGASVADAQQKLQYDLFYIKYFSILFDLSIVLQTIRVVLWPDGAR
jgi:sugar transferase (PEP-CTERM system associated)